MSDLLQGFSLTVGEAGLLTLIVTTGLLVVGTLALSAFALVKRNAHMRRERELEALSAQWLTPVLGAIGDPALVPSVHTLVEDDDAVRFLDFVIEYARRVRGGERQVLCDLAHPFLPRILDRVDARNTELRAWAVQVLGTLGLPEYEERVLGALDDASPLVAMIAARALARAETPQYAPAVLSRVDRFNDWSKMFLAAMLSSMGPSVAADLRTGLGDGSLPPGTRAVMAEALRLQRDFLAGDVAAQVARSEHNVELLASSLRLLATVGRPEHAGAVRPLVTSQNPIVRAQALGAMGSLASEGDLPAMVRGHEGREPLAGPARGAERAGRRRAGDPRAHARFRGPERGARQSGARGGGPPVSELAWALVEGFNWVVLTYFVLLNGVYLGTSLFAFSALRRYALRLRSLDLTDLITSAGAPPISLIAPAYNEALTCVESVRSLLTHRVSRTTR